MRQKALELAKYLDRLNGYMDMPRDILDITQPAAAIIRELVEELYKREKQVVIFEKALMQSRIEKSLAIADRNRLAKDNK